MGFGVRSDTGRVRENNEDSFRLAPELNLFVLSDGMGGQASGEVASRLAAETVVKHCRDTKANPTIPFVGERIEGITEATNRLASGVRLANQVVHAEAQKNPSRQGMGATIVAVQFDGERMSLVHVGDSRAYRLRGGEIEQLTQDHSFVAEQVRKGAMTPTEAENSKLQSVLLRALGPDAEVAVDVTEELVMDGDTLLICSDGLTRELPDAQIAAILGDTENEQEAANRLIDLANQAGGGDNVTAIVLRSSLKSVGTFARIGRWFKGSKESS
jgi:PPM family protein phosphatase